jgi:uncharacterized protein (DUF2225 family)
MSFPKKVILVDKAGGCRLIEGNIYTAIREYTEAYRKFYVIAECSNSGFHYYKSRFKDVELQGFDALDNLPVG